MKIAFASNFLNHHQLSFCQKCLEDNEFYFLASMPVAREQLNLGYDNMNETYDFVVKVYESHEAKEKALAIIDSADVVIVGSCAFDFDMIKKRIEDDKLTFWFSERLFKRSPLMRFYPPTVKRVLKQCTRYRKKNFYLLSAGGYTAKDYQWFHAFPDKKFAWGYFPPTRTVDAERLIREKSNNKEVKLLWAARYLNWKRPKYVIELARYLKKRNINFSIDMLGEGVLLPKMRQLAERKKVERFINFVGAVPTEQVRNSMDKAQIFLFTSTRTEGWGAVLNESMNSACAAVAYRKIGGGGASMIRSGENGLLFKNKQDFFRKVEFLIRNENQRKQIGIDAAHTIACEWNGETAAIRFIEVCKKLLNGEVYHYAGGPMS